MKLEGTTNSVTEIREMLSEIKSSLTNVMIYESFLQSSRVLLKNSLSNIEKILVILRKEFDDSEKFLKPLHAGLSRSMETLNVKNGEGKSLSSSKSTSDLSENVDMYDNIDDDINNLNDLKENYMQVMNDIRNREINGYNDNNNKTEVDNTKPEINDAKSDVCGNKPEATEPEMKRDKGTKNEKRRRKRDSSTLFDISLDDLSEPDHSGMLQEKHSGKEWWCVLQDQHLCMFPSQNPQELAYDVLLVPCCEISLDDVYTESPVFRLTQVGSTPWVFSAGIERNLRAWIRALYRASGRDDYDACMRSAGSRSKRKGDKKQKRRDMKVFSNTIEEMEEGEEVGWEKGEEEQEVEVEGKMKNGEEIGEIREEAENEVKGKIKGKRTEEKVEGQEEVQGNEKETNNEDKWCQDVSQEKNKNNSKNEIDESRVYKKIKNTNEKQNTENNNKFSLMAETIVKPARPTCDVSNATKTRSVSTPIPPFSVPTLATDQPTKQRSISSPVPMLSCTAPAISVPSQQRKVPPVYPKVPAQRSPQPPSHLPLTNKPPSLPVSTPPTSQPPTSQLLTPNQSGATTLQRKETKCRVKVLRWLKKAFVVTDSPDISIIGDIFIKLKETDKKPIKVWCLLRNKELYCYRDVMTAKLHLIIPLTNCLVSSEASPSPPYVFYIERHSGERLCTFYAKTGKEREKWLEVLRNKRGTVLLKEFCDSDDDSDEQEDGHEEQEEEKGELDDNEDEEGYLQISTDDTSSLTPSEVEDLYAVPRYEENNNEDCSDDGSYVSILAFENEVMRRRTVKEKGVPNFRNKANLKNLTEKDNPLQTNLLNSTSVPSFKPRYIPPVPEELTNNDDSSLETGTNSVQENDGPQEVAVLDDGIGSDTTTDFIAVQSNKKTKAGNKKKAKKLLKDVETERHNASSGGTLERKKGINKKDISSPIPLNEPENGKGEEKSSKLDEEDYDHNLDEIYQDPTQVLMDAVGGQPGMEGRIKLRDNLLTKEKKEQIAILEGLKKLMNRAKDKMIVVNNSNQAKSDAVDTKEEYLTINLELVKAKKRLIDIETELRELRLFATQHQSDEKQKEPAAKRKKPPLTRRPSKEIKVYTAVESPEVDPMAFNSDGEPPPPRKVFNNIKMFENLHTK